MAIREEEQTRHLSDYVAIVRRRFWIIALITVVTLGAAAAYSFSKPPVYRASMKVVVGQGEGLFRSDFVNAVEELTQTMGDLLESDVVAEDVIEELDLDLTTPELLGNLGVATEPSTAVVEVTYDDTDADRGRMILDQVGDSFEELVQDRLSNSGGSLNDKAGNNQISANVFDDAHLVPGQVEPKPLRDLAVAGALGVLLGLLVAFLREQLDKTIRNVEQAEVAFGHSVTATLPPGFLGFRPFAQSGQRGRGKGGKKNRLDPVLAELALQRLRASILWSWQGDERRTLLVTSAHPEEGKTTTAANLAVSMAVDGRDVILVDADLRKPLLHSYLDIDVGSQTIGLDALVRGEVTLAEALIEIPVGKSAFGTLSRSPNRGNSHSPGAQASQKKGRLRAVLAAPGYTRPSEFGLDRIVEVVEELRGQADYVIFDAPPILVVTDSYPLVVAADGVIAVVRNGKSTSPATTALGRTLARLRIRNVRSAELVMTEVETELDVGRYSYYSSGPAPEPTAKRPPAPVPPAATDESNRAGLQPTPAAEATATRPRGHKT